MRPEKEKHRATQPRTRQARGFLSAPSCHLGVSSSGCLSRSLAKCYQEGQLDFTRILPVGTFWEQGSQDPFFTHYPFKKVNDTLNDNMHSPAVIGTVYGSLSSFLCPQALTTVPNVNSIMIIAIIVTIRVATIIVTPPPTVLLVIEPKNREVQ